MKSKRLTLVLVTLGPLAAACGHRGDPLPPRRKTPPAPHDFRLVQRGDALEALATAPVASVDGVAYQTLTIEFLWAEGLKDLEKAGHHLAVAAVPGSRVVQTLPLPAPGSAVRVAVRALAGGDKGARTLTLSLVAQPPLEAPGELGAVIAEDGVNLSWHGVRPKEIPRPASPTTLGPPAFPGGSRPPGSRPPSPLPSGGPGGSPPSTEPAAPPALAPPAAGTQPGATPTTPGTAPTSPGATPTTPGTAPAAGPRRSGFLVYRRIGSDRFGEPLLAEPLDARSLVDPGVPLGATACYVVRAVGSTDPLIESASSNEACVDNRDVTPPATPSGVAVLPREGGLEVLWGPSADADLAGYRVYRTAAGGARERIAEAPTNRSSWVDDKAVRGVAYAYTVTAFDQAGNESAPAEPVEASLP